MTNNSTKIKRYENIITHLNDDALKLLEFALREALAEGAGYIGIEHIELALKRIKETHSSTRTPDE